MPVYIYERIDIEGGGRGGFIELIRSRWSQHAEQRFGVRLVGVWATVGSTANWPEADLLWEMQDWAHFARAQAAQFPREEVDAYGAELWAQALEYRQRGHASLLTASRFSPDLDRVRAEGLRGEVYLYEDVRARPGALPTYHDALEAEYLPVAASRGVRLLGAYAHALRPNVGINLWVLRDWAHWGELMQSEDAHPGVQKWLARCGELLEDLDGHLLAPPPRERLRT